MFSLKLFHQCELHRMGWRLNAGNKSRDFLIKIHGKVITAFWVFFVHNRIKVEEVFCPSLSLFSPEMIKRTIQEMKQDEIMVVQKVIIILNDKNRQNQQNLLQRYKLLGVFVCWIQDQVYFNCKESHKAETAFEWPVLFHRHDSFI